jgi:hypothetical protein
MKTLLGRGFLSIARQNMLSDYHLRVWPATGVFCRGGVFVDPAAEVCVAAVKLLRGHHAKSSG